MNLTLVRHTSVNVLPGICYGHTDVDVAHTFEHEKSKVLNSIGAIHFNKIFSSPLIRCQKLANALFSTEKIIMDNRLKELNFGHWEGVSWDKIEQTDEARWWFEDYISRPCPGGESYNDLIFRVSAFINDLKTNCSTNDNLLIITHGGVIRVILSHIRGVPPLDVFNIKVEYGGVFKLMI